MKSAIRFMKRKFRGFTLVELIVVITILAILATVGFLALSGYSEDAKGSAVAANVRSLQTAISSESVTAGNSPRYYVIHNTGAALSWAFVYVDGSQIFLSGGNWNQAGTNYSAGNPDYAKLKLNPEKFKMAFFPETSPNWFSSAFAAYGPGLYDSKYLTVGAMDADVPNGTKKRQISYFQIAGISPTTGKATVTGSYPSTSSSSGSVVWLIAADPLTNATGALVDGVVASVSAQVGCSASAQTSNGHSYAVPSASNGALTPVTSSWVAVTGGTITYSQSFLCSNGTVSAYGSETANSPSCSANYANVSGTCVPNSCKAIKAAYPASADGTYSIDYDWAGSAPSFQVLCDMTTDGGGWTNVNYNFWNVVALTANNGIAAAGLSNAKIAGSTASMGTSSCPYTPVITYFTAAFSGAISYTEVLYNVKSYPSGDIRCWGAMRDIGGFTGYAKFSSFSDGQLGRCDNNWGPGSGYGFGGETDSSDLIYKAAKNADRSVVSLGAACSSSSWVMYLKVNSLMVR